jgi:hypothetical protein
VIGVVWALRRESLRLGSRQREVRLEASHRSNAWGCCPRPTT